MAFIRLSLFGAELETIMIKTALTLVASAAVLSAPIAAQAQSHSGGHGGGGGGHFAGAARGGGGGYRGGWHGGGGYHGWHGGYGGWGWGGFGLGLALGYAADPWYYGYYPGYAYYPA